MVVAMRSGVDGYALAPRDRSWLGGMVTGPCSCDLPRPASDRIPSAALNEVGPI